jgi:hypothetical protein
VVLRQSVSTVQLVRQTLPLQAYAPQEVTGWLHVPEPLHEPTAVAEPGLHPALPQLVELPG